MERARPMRSPLRGGSPRRRPFTAEVLGLRGAKAGKGDARLLKTPRVFHRQNDIHHMKRNELRANLLPCILQTPRTAEGAIEDIENSKKRSDYTQILGSRSESESVTQDFIQTTTIAGFPQEWDPAYQAVYACNSLRDLVNERSSRFRRPVDGMVTSSNLPFVHKVLAGW